MSAQDETRDGWDYRTLLDEAATDAVRLDQDKGAFRRAVRQEDLPAVDFGACDQADQEQISRMEAYPARSAGTVAWCETSPTQRPRCRSSRNNNSRRPE